MRFVKGNEGKAIEIFENFAERYGARWDGEELFKDSEGDYLRLISFSFNGDTFITAGEMNASESICFSNTKIEQNRIVLRLVQAGVDGKISHKNRETEHNLIMYNTNQELDFILHENKLTKWLTVSFPVSVFNQFAGERDFKLKKLVSNSDPWFSYFTLTPEMEGHLRSIFEIRDNKSLRRSVFLAKAIEILGHIRQELDAINFNVTTNKSSVEIEKMIAFKNALLSNYSKPPNVKVLAEELHVSESTLQRNFKELFHKPVLKFFNEHRLEEAHRQIKYTERSITEISYELGYAHVHHLSNAFKSYYGYSPNRIRTSKKIRVEDN